MTNIRRRLKDINDGLLVDLAYRVYPGADIIAKRATIRNQTESPILLESAQSGAWFLPAGVRMGPSGETSITVCAAAGMAASASTASHRFMPQMIADRLTTGG